MTATLETARAEPAKNDETPNADYDFVSGVWDDLTTVQSTAAGSGMTPGELTASLKQANRNLAHLGKKRRLFDGWEWEYGKPKILRPWTAPTMIEVRA